MTDDYGYLADDPYAMSMAPPDQGTALAPERFKDMYPGNDYSGMIAGRNAQDALKPEPSFWDKLNTRSVATNPASTPLVGALNGLANIFPSARPAVAANQQMWNAQSAQAQQQQAIDLHKKAEDRQSLVQGVEMLHKGLQIPAGSLRKAYLDNIAQHYGKLTGQDSHVLFDTLKKSNDEEYSTAIAGVQGFLDANPELGLKDGGLAFSNPKAFGEILAHGAALVKTRNEAASDKAFMDAGRNGSNSPQVPSGSPSVTPTPDQPQAQPGGFQIPKTGGARQAEVFDTVDQIGKQTGASPHVVAMVKSSLGIETNGYDSQAISPKGARGIGQFMPATAQQYGVQNPEDDSQAIAGMFKYYTALDKRFPGQPQLQFASYNAGEGRVQQAGNQIPNIRETQGYVQRGFGEYTKLLGGRPASEVVLNAASEDQQQLATLNQRAAALREQLDRYRGIPTSERQQRGLNNLKEAYKATTEERDRLEKRFETTVPGELDAYSKAMPGGLPFNQRPQPERERIQANFEKEKQARILETSTNQGLAAADRAILPEAHLYLDEDKKPARITTNGQLLKEQDRRAQAGEPPLTKWEPLKPDNQIYTKTESQASGIKGIQRIMKYLDDPKTARLVGSFMASPEAGIEKTLANVFGKNIPDQYREVSAEISHVTSGIIHDAIGGAQTPTEYARLKPLIGSMDDPNPASIKSKMTVLHNAMTEDYNTRLAGFDANQVLAPRTWKPFTRIPTALDRQATAAPSAEADAQPGASQLPPSGKAPNPINAAIEEYNRKRGKK